MIRDYQALKAFTDQVSSAYLRTGDTISMEEARGASLCRQGILKDVTARVADTDIERIEDLETAETDHESRISAVESLAADAATEDDLTLAENRITTLEDEVDDHEGRITTIETTLGL